MLRLVEIEARAAGQQEADAGERADHAGPRDRALQRTQARAAGARIGRGLRRAGTQRPRREQTEARRGRPASPRGSCRDGAGARPAASVMKRLTMRSSSEWNDTTTSRPPGASSSARLRQRALDLAEFVVHPDAQRLEAARRRIDAGAVRRQHAADDGGEPAGRGDRRLGARGHDGARDAARRALLAEFEQQIGQLAFRQRIDQIGGGRAAAAHAHVQRAVGAEREAARRVIELERRDAEIQHHAIQRA